MNGAAPGVVALTLARDCIPPPHYTDSAGGLRGGVGSGRPELIFPQTSLGRRVRMGA